MNEQQKNFLLDLLRTAINSALFASIWSLPRWVQLTIVAAGVVLGLYLLR